MMSRSMMRMSTILRRSCERSQRWGAMSHAPAGAGRSKKNVAGRQIMEVLRLGRIGTLAREGLYHGSDRQGEVGAFHRGRRAGIGATVAGPIWPPPRWRFPVT